MEGDLRVTHQAEYSEALGLAAFCFARCEWDACYFCERLQAGYLGTIKLERKTAGRIARDLKTLVAKIQSASLKTRCEPIVAEFHALVKHRNDLMHGNPGTAPNGDQILSGADGIWTVRRINAATECQIRLNDLLYHYLT